MARKLFEKQGIRTRNGGLATGTVYVVYTDSAGTVLADISTTSGGSAIAGSTVTVGDRAGLGLATLRFYGPPAGTDTLYLRCPSDTSLGVQEVEADEDERLDALEAGVGVTSGLACDGVRLRGVTSASAGTTVTVPSAAFTQADIGKIACVYTNALAGTITTIASVESATSLTLAAASGVTSDASTSNTSAAPTYLVYGTDDAAALQAMLDAAYVAADVLLDSGGNAQMVTGNNTVTVPALNAGIMVCRANAITIHPGLAYNFAPQLFNMMSSRTATFITARPGSVNRSVLSVDFMFGGGMVSGDSTSQQAHTKLGDLEFFHQGSSSSATALELKGNHHEMDTFWLKNGAGAGIFHNPGQDSDVKAAYFVGVRYPLRVNGGGNIHYHSVRFDTCGPSAPDNVNDPIFYFDLYGGVNGFFCHYFDAFPFSFPAKCSAVVAIGQNATFQAANQEIYLNGTVNNTGGDLAWIDHCAGSTRISIGASTKAKAGNASYTTAFNSGIVYGSNSMTDADIDITIDLPTGVTPFSGTRKGVLTVIQDSTRTLYADTTTVNGNLTVTGGSITGTLTGVPPGLSFVKTTADQTLAQSSTTLVDATSLSFSVLANTVYKLDAFLIYDAATAADLKIGWSGPASATMEWVPHSLTSGVTVANGSVDMTRRNIGATHVFGGAAVGTKVVARITGLLMVSSTAGTFKMQAAQGTSDATNVTIYTNSWITLQTVA